MTSTAGRPRVALTVDLAVLTLLDDIVQVLMVERAKAPFRGALALPGGFVEAGECPDVAAERELREETRLEARPLRLERLSVYGAAGRDPRGRMISVCFVAFSPDVAAPTAGSDAAAARWVPVAEVVDGTRPVAFDHRLMIGDALRHVRDTLQFSTIAASFCPPVFTLRDLRRVYETVWDAALDPDRFRIGVTGAPGFVERCGGPGGTFRRGPAGTLNPPIPRHAVPPPPAEPRGAR
ncbi:NUDIX domain-containing protein [Longispora urticae]